SRGLLLSDQRFELVVVLLPRDDVEMGDGIARTERVLLDDADFAGLVLDDVVRGPRMPAEPQARTGAGVRDVDVFETPDIWHMLVAGQSELHARPDQDLKQVSRI